jgi:transcriptional regulator with XRE-family HTH domain
VPDNRPAVEQRDKATLMVFGRAVRERRKALDLSQEDVAGLSGLHVNYIGGIERGERNLGLLNLLRLADALRLTPSALLGCYDKPSG